MEENAKDNKNLITALIALIVLVIIAVFYWDRQKQQNIQRTQAEIQGGLLEQWGPQAQPQIQAALQGQPMAFSKQISYKNIIARTAPSVVSVNVGSSFINQNAPALQPQPVAQTQQPAQNQPADQSPEATGFGQYVWGGRMGGWALGPGGYLLCPNCGTQVPHQRSVPAYTVNCPSCGTQMMREGAPGPYPIPQGAQAQPVAAQQKDRRFQALGRGGSGVIVNSRGYVLTNHHVVHGARDITVTLSLGQITKTYPAQLIDEAPNLDFAILKIVAKGNEQFTPAPIGNSSEASVGDEVLAIGSPFGLQQSVTFGIVSNTRRTMTVGKKTFTNFIQTDAPINPGSSGGPLVNVNGEVIGINTAIYSPTQAFSGIGFASPIDPAKAAFPEFIETTPNVAGVLRRNIPNWARGPLRPAAQIQRGQGLYPWCPPAASLRQAANTQSQSWLGIRARAVDKKIRAFLGLPMARGVIIMEVFDNSPCRVAGLQRGDVIIRVDNRSVKDGDMLETFLNKKKPGDKMKLTIYRDGKKMNLSPTLTIRPTGLQGGPRVVFWPEPQGAALQARAVALAQQPFDPENVNPPGLTGVLKGGEVGAGEIEALGMGVEDLAPELALAYGIPKGEKGVIITESATQAAAAGLLAGDVIKAINNQRVRNVVDFIKAMSKASLKKGISLDVYRQGQRFNLTMKG